MCLLQLRQHHVLKLSLIHLHFPPFSLPLARHVIPVLYPIHFPSLLHVYTPLVTTKHLPIYSIFFSLNSVIIGSIKPRKHLHCPSCLLSASLSCSRVCTPQLRLPPSNSLNKFSSTNLTHHVH